MPGIEAITADARLYGLHCTLKPPMRLATPYPAFRAAAAAVAGSLAPFELPPLAVADLSGFLALRETRPSPELQALADACVERMDRHRAPPDEAELARRRKGGLSPEGEAMLQRWGYPGVFGLWRFHMTLTRRLDAADRAMLQPIAQAHFAASLAHPRRVVELCIFTQAAYGAPFLIAERLPFG